MHGQATPSRSTRPEPSWSAQPAYVVLAGILTVLLLACVAGLWVKLHDPLAAVAAALTLALFGAGVFIVHENRLRTMADRRALEREIEQHGRLFETSLDLILVTDRQGRFLQVSPSSKAILDYWPEQMVGHIGIDFIHPDDLESTRNEMRLGRRGREIRNFDSRYVHRDGHAVTLSWTGAWSQAEERHYFIGRDISEQKRLETAERAAKETLTAVINASPVAIICLAPDKTVMVWSRAAEKIFGYTSEETVGHPAKLVPPGDEAEFDALFARALAGETLRDVRVKRRRKDGSLADISFDAAAMFNNDKVEAIAFALDDITERTTMEQQLRQSQKLDAIGQLTGGIAHDFNNMLSVITGTIDILASGVADKPELAAIAKLISEAADRGAELTSHLLAFARKQPLQPRTTDIKQILTEAAHLIQPTMGDQVEIEFHLHDDAWPAMVDPAQLVTAVLNLAVNARDAMENDGKLTIETANVFLDEDYCNLHSEVEPGPYVMVAVSDSGPGIPEAIREKIFEPFFTTKEIGKGTGLGLSMIYGFVKQSGGHIKLYSEIGHGTTFKIYLPRAGAPLSIEARDAAAVQDQGCGETILVVEDDPVVRAAVTVQLESLGYETITAAKADEALAIIDSGAAFDLLFTDVVMSGSMNGRRLAEEASKRRASLKVLYTSGYTEDAIIHHGRLERGVLLLPKPYRKSDLARMIRRALAGSEVVAPATPPPQRLERFG
jgi:PAS domain S-box-containing protein